MGWWERKEDGSGRFGQLGWRTNNNTNININNNNINNIHKPGLQIVISKLMTICPPGPFRPTSTVSQP
jgi:hypothetical protein